MLESDRKDLAIQALARSTTISDLSVQHSVSRKFVYQQARKAGAALDEVFLSGAPEDDVMFHLTVTKTGLHDEIFLGAKPVRGRCRCRIDVLLPPGCGGTSRRRHLGRAFT